MIGNSKFEFIQLQISFYYSINSIISIDYKV